MATYNQWNQAFLTYFIEGISQNSTIFLAVDDEVIHEVGSQLVLQEKEPSEDFRQAIRRKVIIEDRICIENIREDKTLQEPKAVTFLVAMVWAASKMADEGEIHQRDYFKRLREVLGLPIEAGRPNGLDSGAEEPLWQEWNRWLQEHDFLPSAQRGEGSSKYINYPISQTLLRKTDRNRLRKLFNEKGWPPDWELERLAAMVQKERATLTNPLQKLLSARGERYEAVTEAIYDVYERWQYDPYALGVSSFYSRRGNLLAGLLRAEDFQGEATYYLYPKQPRRRRAAQEVQIRIGNTPQRLVQDRPGWYNPVHEVAEEELNNGARYAIEQPLKLNSLILPPRPFWILTPDPENPDFGDYATYGPPQLGTHFLLLCRHELLPQLKILRRERLIQWDGEPEEVLAGWVELYNCMLLAQNWSVVLSENDITLTEEVEVLHAALQPRRSLRISLSGGLRSPQGSGWLEGHGPQITVFGFYPEADVHIFRILDHQEQEVSNTTQSTKPTNQPFPFKWPGKGTYRIAASYMGEKAERLVKIVTWEQLNIAALPERESLKLKGLHICGALVERIKEVKGGWQYMLSL